MFIVTRRNSNRIDLELSGKISDEEMKQGLDQILEASTDFSQGTMLYRISDFKLPSIKGLAIEITRLPELFKAINRFEKVAVIADKVWIQRIGEIKGALLPGITVRAFNVGEDTKAEAWLAQ